MFGLIRRNQNAVEKREAIGGVALGSATVAALAAGAFAVGALPSEPWPSGASGWRGAHQAPADRRTHRWAS